MMSEDNRDGVCRIVSGDGRKKVLLECFTMDNGYIVHITGGDSPHVGGVAVGIPRPSSKDPERITANVSVISIIGHKDDELARPLADKIVKALGKICVVIAGIHIDNATRDDIGYIIELSNLTVDKLIDNLTK